MSHSADSLTSHDHHSHDDHHGEHLSPSARLSRLLMEDKGDLAAILVYVAMTGVLSLAVPLSAQALVNTIAAGVFIQPLVVLTLIVLGCLLFAGALRLLKVALLERLQQRIFARVALRLATQLPRIKTSALTGKYAPELVNRFFDVLTVQKSLTKILLDAPSSALQIVIGLTLMALYSPYLLAFDLFVVVSAFFIMRVLGTGALKTSINESVQKYRVAQWLEEVGRCQTGFKTSGDPAFAIERADSLVVDYVSRRRAHFRVLFRQSFGHFLFRAVASAGILAVGGWLVINRELTLGQLVAANIIVVSVLAALEKLISLLEQFYDLLTAVDKIGHVTDLPVEREGGRQLSESATDSPGANVMCRGVRFSYRAGVEVLAGLDLEITAGERVSIVGKSGAGKSTLAALLSGMLEPHHGSVLIDRMEIREADLQSLRRAVGIVSDSNEIFEGTIEENILLGRDHISHEDLRRALEMTQLASELATFAEGIKTRLTSEGRNISRGQRQRLLLARAVVGRPRLLILDEAFTGIDERDKLLILEEIFRPEHGWTIVDISHDPEVVMRSSRVCVISDGRIVEADAPAELARAGEGNVFGALFPSLRLNEAQ